MRSCVVLVNFSGAADTNRCIQSLLDCPDYPQLVVVDNTPNDPELDTVVAAYPNAKVIRAPKNLGFGGGNNLGINWALAHTDCEFVFILNNDAKVERYTIAKLESGLDSHPEAGIIAPRIVFMDRPDVLWYGGGEVSWLRGGGKTPGVFGASDAPLAMQAREVSFASGCAMLLRRELLRQLHGFDERFFMYEEDLELCLRAQNLGWKIWYEPSALALHVVHASSRGEQGNVGPLSPLNKNLCFYAYHFVRNRMINMRLHAHGYHRLLFVMGFSLWLLKYAGIFLLHKRWDGLAAMIKGWQSYQLCFARDCDKAGG